jgi:hypothetical protein
MRGKYRQTFLRVSADGEETTQSANLKVETNKTLPVVVEGVRVSTRIMTMQGLHTFTYPSDRCRILM